MAAASEGERRRLSEQEFKDVIGRFASGVTVVTARNEGRPVGTTASAVTSLSADPPMILICMNRASSTGAAVRAAKRFAVNILGEGDADLAMRFAAKGVDKFAGVPTSDGEHGEPLLDGALATLECAVVEEVTGGTHWVFLAEVERASGREGAPLAYFRGRYGRLQLVDDALRADEVGDVVEGALRARHTMERGAVVTALGDIDVAAARGLLERGPVALLEHVVERAGGAELLEAYRRLDVLGHLPAPPAARGALASLLDAVEAGDLPRALEAIDAYAQGTTNVARSLLA